MTLPDSLYMHMTAALKNDHTVPESASRNHRAICADVANASMGRDFVRTQETELANGSYGTVAEPEWN